MLSISRNGIGLRSVFCISNSDVSLYHFLELESFVFKSWASLSLYSSFAVLISELTSFFLCLNWSQIIFVFLRLAFLNSLFLCLMFLFMFEFIHWGSDGLIITVLFGIDSLAAC